MSTALRISLVAGATVAGLLVPTPQAWAQG
jgi:hypothetical protein